MVIFVYGLDSFRSASYLKKLIGQFKKERDPFGYNVSILDSAITEEAQRILAEVLSVPFLSERRLVVVKNLLVSKEKTLQNILLDRIKQDTIPESTVLVFWESIEAFKGKEALALFDLFKRQKYKEYFKPLEARELGIWIGQEIKNRGGNIDKQALSYIMRNAGGDMWFLDRIIDQLVSYKGDKTILESDLVLFMDNSADDNVFNLVDAIVLGDKGRAFGMIAEQYKMGKDSFYVFAMLVRQFRILLQIKDVLDRGLKPDAKEMGLHPFVLKKTLSILGRYNLDQLRLANSRLLDIDIEAKTGKADHSLLLDIFVAAR
ncbi:MAG: DNA polymerase III subunit delta [Candidatus Magasanikbacteria bacterium]|nr:DNA polymerase III subunit delta [Candidatus Magasanikbacteria bacterium]